MDTNTLAERVTFLRKSSGVGRKKLSLECKLGASHVGQLERGDVTNPALDTLRALATRTGAPLGWIVSGDGEPPSADDIASRFVGLAHDDDEPDAAPGEAA